MKEMARQKPMTLLDFQGLFNNEDACREHLYRMRWPEGFVCPKCGLKDEPFNVASRNLHQCKHCGYQASVTAGTVMEKTHIPLLKWFWAMFLMSGDKRGCSALQISKELDLCYSTAWFLCHRIRSAMGERDTEYVLSGHIEVDDAFFGAPSSNGKRGRGTDKAIVLVGLSLNGEGYPEYVKMEVAPDVKGETAASFAVGNIEPGSSITSDRLGSYNALAKEGFSHEGKLCDPIGDPERLKWLHVVISNAKAYILGTYHGLDKRHLQSYLNEFCYRFNRRKFNLQHFNRTLFACASASRLTYAELTR
jgi:transposase-like protein